MTKPNSNKYGVTNPRNRVTVAGDYRPTAAQERLLEVVCDPYHRMASVTRQCELAGISRETYYRWMRDPEFAAYYGDLCREVVKQHRAQLVNIGLREARKGGSAGFGYWRELSKMAQLIEDDKVKVDHEFTGPLEVRFVAPERNE